MIQGTELGDILNITKNAVSNIKKRNELIDGTDTVAAGNGRRYYTPQGIRKILEHRGYNFKRKNISVCNVKGGVGKTTISVNLAKKISALGFKTLLVDIDKQGNATDQLHADGSSLDTPCLVDVITGDATIDDTIIKINETLDLIPSNLNNQLLDIEITRCSLNYGAFFKNQVRILWALLRVS